MKNRLVVVLIRLWTYEILPIVRENNRHRAGATRRSRVFNVVARRVSVKMLLSPGFWRGNVVERRTTDDERTIERIHRRILSIRSHLNKYLVGLISRERNFFERL